MLLTPSPEFVPDCGSAAGTKSVSARKAKCPATWRRRLRNFGCLLAAAGCLWLFRAQLMAAASSVLVCDEHFPEGGFALVLGGDQCHRDAARLYEQRTVQKILLFERPPGRLVRLGILASPTAMASEELAREGVPPDKIEVLPPSSPDDPSLGSAIAARLEQNHSAHLVILCDAFSSRSLRWSLNRNLSRAEAGRLHVRPLKNRRCDEQNWWHSKEGVSTFARAWLSLVWPLVHGEPEPVWRECDPEHFQPVIE